MTTIAYAGAIAPASSEQTDPIASETVTEPAVRAERSPEAHKLGLTETIGLGGGGFGARYRPKGSGFYVEPGAYWSFHAVPAASNDPAGRYLGFDPADEASWDAVAADPRLVADGFLNRLDTNPYRFRVGFQGDILPELPVGPTIDFSFDPVQTGIAAVRGGQLFSYAFEEGEAAAEPLKPYLGDDIDAQADAARDGGVFAAGALAGTAGFISSLSLGVGFHVRPMDELEMSLTAGTSGLGVYRALRNYDERVDTAQAVMQAAEVKAGATWRF